MMGTKERPLQHHPNSSKEDRYGNLCYDPESYKAGIEGDQKLRVPQGIQ